MKLEFKAKVRDGFVRFPNSFKRRHVIREHHDTCRLERHYNSDLFENMLQTHLLKTLRLPLGMTVLLGDLPNSVTFRGGFLHTFTVEL